MNDFDLSPMIIKKDFVQKICDNVDYNNNYIFEYYLRLANEVKSNKEALAIQEKAYRLKECNQLWILDKYKDNRIKNFKKTYLCRDRFCANCKKVRQSQRMNKYMDLLQQYDDNLYFVTLTVPNCSGDKLNQTIKNIYSSFSMLVKYFAGHKKIRGIDFDKFGYLGAIKSLEVSFKKEGRNRFHPHIHCAFVFQNYKPGKEYLETRFSVDKTGRRDVRLFNRETNMLQKVWYLLINGIKVTKSNLQFYKEKIYTADGVFLKEVVRKNPGYSVVIDKFKPGQYQEMFKYMIKDKAMNGEVMDYDTFKALYYGLRNVRQLAGYGIFYNVKDIKDLDLDEEVNSLFNGFIEYLNKKETPQEVSETPLEVLKNDKYIYITKKKIYSFLRLCVLQSRFEDKEVSINNNTISYEDYTLYNQIFEQLKQEKDFEVKQRLKNMQGYEDTYYL